ncbi:MAG TPA: hypothetical protein HA362_01835 [Nanoarchaeota archaeon]|nr:hypothetical protein [Nanoarchaeota archaeon]
MSKMENKSINRKTIENKILTAVPGMNENSADCGLPFYDRKDELVRQIDELAGKIYSLVVGFAEDAAVAAYKKKLINPA